MDGSLWPFGDKDPEQLRTVGFTDDELTDLTKFEAADRSPWPWLSWTTETYGTGKGLRRWIGWPDALPLPISCDHGVALCGALLKHERDFAGRVHLVWGADRERVARNLSSKTIVRVPHPWITYREHIKPQRSADRRGTLVFYPHTTASVAYAREYHATYLDQLKQLGDRFGPLVVTLHMNDVRPEVVAAIRAAGFPIVTAGATWSHRFVDRFYDLIDRFEFATSSSGGSELFYCHEFGLKYFLHGEPPRYFNTTDPNLPVGERRPLDLVEQKNWSLKRKLFGSAERLEVDGKDDFVMRLLGLDAQPDLPRLRLLLARELLRLWNHEGKGLSRTKALVKALLGRP